MQHRRVIDIGSRGAFLLALYSVTSTPPPRPEGPNFLFLGIAVVSVVTGIPVRADVAMTGEITLRGQVLPIGGLKEKLLAAHRGGIKHVIIPGENEKDLKEIPENVQAKLNIHPVKWMDEVLELALERMPEPRLVNASEPAVEPQGDKKSDVAPASPSTGINPH
jgi:hypothetical protein